MPKLARTLALAAMLAVMSLAPVTAVAETHATDHATSQDAEHPATVRRVTSAQQAAADTAHRRLLAQERSLTPTGAPAQLPNPMPPAEPGRQPGWLTPALAALVSWHRPPEWPCWSSGAPTAAKAPGRRPDHSVELGWEAISGRSPSR